MGGKQENYRTKQCVDCGAATSGVRCWPCGHKQRGIDSRGKNNPRYTTGKSTNKDGYVILSSMHGHPNAFRGYLKEHIYVKSEEIGRPLIKGEMVHHKNGIKHDNRPENLELCWKQPPGQRVEDLIAYLESTGYEVRGISRD